MPEVNPNTSAIISSESRPNFASSSENPPQPVAPAIKSVPNVPAQAPPVGNPASSGPITPPSENRRLHGFIGATLNGVLSALAGKPVTKYTTDSQGRTVVDPNQPADTVADKAKRLASHALEGLAAGARVPQQKSGLASAMAGLGAGAEDATGKMQAQDAKARQQERENEEAKQQKMVRMHEIARGNALTASTWQHMMESEQDRDPARQQHLSWAKAAEDAGVAVKYASEEEVHQLRESDPEAAAKFQVLPVGMKMVQDAQGQPVLDETGKPKMTGQFALIDGLHDGNIAVPQSFVDDVKKYAKYAGVTNMDSLKEGDELSMQHFIKLATSTQEGKKKQAEGWAKPELGWQDGKPVQINPVTQEIKPFAKDVIPNVENKPADTEQQRQLRGAQEREADAKAKEALANAAITAQNLLDGKGNPKELLPAYAEAIKSLPQQAQGLLKAVPPKTQLSLLKVATGDAKLEKTFPTRVTAKSGQIDANQATTLVTLINPSWNSQLYDTVQKLNNDFINPKGTGGAIRSFNQFLVHADDARMASNDLVRTNSPYINRPVNDLKSVMLGDPSVNRLMTAIMAARTEWGNFIRSGHAGHQEETAEEHILMNDKSTPAQIMGVLNMMGTQAVGRLDQINETYRTLKGIDWPNLVTPSGRAAAKNLGIENQITKYKTGGLLQGVMPNGQAAPPQLTNMHSNGAVTIGWDGKQWVDSKTGQPYTGAQ